MSREIKFRAWHKKDKAMYVVYNLAFTDEGGPPLEHDSIQIRRESEWQWIEYDEFFLMQYTGLKDKGGVEMDWWEDDILEDEDGFRFRIDYLGDVGRYGFLALSDLPIENYYFPFYDYQLDELKKVGNIHQNPELLENKDT